MIVEFIDFERINEYIYMGTTENISKYKENDEKLKLSFEVVQKSVR